MPKTSKMKKRPNRTELHCGLGSCICFLHLALRRLDAGEDVFEDVDKAWGLLNEIHLGMDEGEIKTRFPKLKP